MIISLLKSCCVPVLLFAWRLLIWIRRPFVDWIMHYSWPFVKLSRLSIKLLLWILYISLALAISSTSGLSFGVERDCQSILTMQYIGQPSINILSQNTLGTTFSNPSTRWFMWLTNHKRLYKKTAGSLSSLTLVNPRSLTLSSLILSSLTLCSFYLEFVWRNEIYKTFGFSSSFRKSMDSLILNFTDYGATRP